MAKQTYSVTIDSDIQKSFKTLCKNEQINQSMLIEAFMRTYVNGHIKLEFVNQKIEVQVEEKTCVNDKTNSKTKVLHSK